MLAGDNGQTTKDKSTSVVLASDHAAVPVTITNASVDLTVDIDASNLATHADAVAINTKQTDGGQKTQIVGTTAASLLPDAAAPADSMTAVAMSKIVSYLAAFNGSSFMLIRAGLTTITATVAGYLNTIPTAKYDTAPGARTNGQSGPLQADANGSLITIDANTPTAAAMVDGVATPTTTKIASFMQGYNGSTWTFLRAGVVAFTSNLTGFLNTMPWAKYDLTPTTRTSGQGGYLQAESDGSLRVSQATRIAGEDITLDVLKTRDSYLHAQITGTTAGTAVKAAAGFIHAVQVGAPAATSVVTIYDNASAASGTVLFKGTLAAGNPFSVVLNKVCVNGIYVVVATLGCDLGVSYA